MTLTSLRLRLLLAAAVSIAAAVGVTGVVLVYLFTEYIESRVYTELQTHLQQLTQSLNVSASGDITITPLADQRFTQPFSGLYWQVKLDGNTHAVSRSLWDEGFTVQPTTAPAGEAQRGIGQGPSNQDLLVLDWSIKVTPGGTEKIASLAIAADRSEIASATAAFTRDLTLWLSLLAIALLLAASIQVGVGLRPLEVLRGRIANVKSGMSSRLAGSYPKEVSPLVEEVNDLLTIREKSVASARARAGDLAHGLKTPLTILAAVARDARAKGDKKGADEIDAQIVTMRRHIERELSRARLGVHKNVRCSISTVTDKMIAAMKKLPRGSGLNWQAGLPKDLSVPMDEQDMTELLGNLLDNARIWARNTVGISSAVSGNQQTLFVDDDGPGVPEDKIRKVLERGERLDSSKKGSGLGLAIATDITEAYGGSLSLAQSPMGGLRVQIVLPAPVAAA